MPIVAEAELVAAITRDRAAGKRIAFLSLAFDLLTITEVRAVKTAASAADRLVVAVIDDAGAHVVKADDRAELVDSLRGAGYVILCAPDRVDALATLVMPDVRP
ncbi:MAG TPA: hypothetical protein VN628_16185 [Vicinamibacterales bacterium]|nr:hypothetical protein [Vicinamibacterales bacterium]